MNAPLARVPLPLVAGAQAHGTRPRTEHTAAHVSTQFRAQNPAPTTHRVDPGDLRTRIVYPAHGAARVAEEEELAASLRDLGADARAVGVVCPDGWWDFPRLDAAWRARDPWLLRCHDELFALLADADVVLASGGAMLHPEFLRQLRAVTVLVCGDDPESSDRLSRPVAPHYDVAFTTNVACVADYRRWGCAQAEWLFPLVRARHLQLDVDVDTLVAAPRDLDVVLLCERTYGLSDRAQRVERLLAAEPSAFVAGPGWPRGAFDDRALRATYLRSKMGWNLHNSIGPCNLRLMQLPAFGILQICDNKSRLGEVFALGEEVVGFDSEAECIDATRYYLAHDDERRRIAAAGCRRVRADYTEARWWQRVRTAIAPACRRKLGREILPAALGAPVHPRA